MTANRNMLKHGIAVIKLRTVSVKQETRKIVVQFVVGGIGDGTGFKRFNSGFDEALQ